MRHRAATRPVLFPPWRLDERRGRAGPWTETFDHRLEDQTATFASVECVDALGDRSEGERCGNPRRASGGWCVDRALRRRLRTGGLPAEAVPSPERLVVDQQRLRLGTRGRVTVQRQAVLRQAGGKGDLKRPRGGGRGSRAISSASAGGTATTACRADTVSSALSTRT